MSSTETSTFTGNGRPTPPSVTGVTTSASSRTAAKMQTMMTVSRPIERADEALAEEAAQAARDQHREDDDRQRVGRVPEKQNEFLDQRHLDQDVAGADATESRAGRRIAPGCGRQAVSQQHRRQRRMTRVAMMLTATSPNSSGTA